MFQILVTSDALQLVGDMLRISCTASTSRALLTNEWAMKSTSLPTAHSMKRRSFSVSGGMMTSGKVEEFDGLSLIEWAADGKIKALKEFGCNIHNYDPYQDGEQPRFRDEKIGWF